MNGPGNYSTGPWKVLEKSLKWPVRSRVAEQCRGSAPVPKTERWRRWRPLRHQRHGSWRVSYLVLGFWRTPIILWIRSMATLSWKLLRPAAEQRTILLKPRIRPCGPPTGTRLNVLIDQNLVLNYVRTLSTLKPFIYRIQVFFSNKKYFILLLLFKSII